MGTMSERDWYAFLSWCLGVVMPNMARSAADAAERRSIVAYWNARRARA